MKRRLVYILAGLLLSLAGAGPSLADARIRTMKYTENKVIDLVGVYGYQVSIEFPSTETIESVAVGDSVAWQVTPNKSATTLFVKPVEEGGPTNMTVVTDGRRYVFGLSAVRPEEVDPDKILFVLKFDEPPPPPPEKAQEPLATGPAVPRGDMSALPEANKKYSYAGAPSLIPSRVFDTGRVTYFQWAEGIDTPAIFLVGPGDKESIVNFAYKDGYIVVDRVAPHYRLRRGDEVTDLYNDGFVPIAPGPDAPQPRADKKKRRWFGLKDGE